MQHDLFISYAREDRERVRRIAEELTRRGYTVWWDTSGLRSGDDYRERIEEALNTAKGVVVAWSRHSVESDFVCDEAARGHRRKMLLPVFIDPAIDPPLGFGGIHTTDLSGWLADPSDAAPFDGFAGDVAAVLGREPAPAPAAPPPSAPASTRPRTSDPRRIAIGGGGLLAAVAAVFLVSRAFGGDDPRPGGPEKPDTVVARSDSAAAVPPPGGRAPLPDNLACLTHDGRGHPLDLRRRARTPPPFAVDTASHLLLDARGEPVPGGAAGSYGTLRDRRFIVAHFSGAPAGAAERYFQQPEVSASTHVMIARDGSVRQMLPFDAAARHAGQSEWRGVRNLNSSSIGIDMENWGALNRRGDRWYPWTGRDSVRTDSVAVVADSAGRSRGWQRYTDSQLDAFIQVSCALRRAYPTLEDVVGHDSISPGRKNDPGPAFPVAAIRARLFPAQ